MTDTDLIAGTLAGDTGAQTAFMRNHYRMLYRTARGILRDDAEAEDVVQEAYLQAFRALGTFRGESKLSTWLVRIAANEALMRRRRGAKAVRMDVDMDDLASGELGPESSAHGNGMRRLLEAHIGALPEGYRKVFRMRAVEELSVGETAAALGIPAVTVRTRYFRARRLLRTFMGGETMHKPGLKHE